MEISTDGPKAPAYVKVSQTHKQASDFAKVKDEIYLMIPKGSQVMTKQAFTDFRQAAMGRLFVDIFFYTHQPLDTINNAHEAYKKVVDGVLTSLQSAGLPVDPTNVYHYVHNEIFNYKISFISIVPA